MVAAAVIGSTVAGGVIGGVTSGAAAGRQSRAARDAAELQQMRYEQTREDLQPYNQGGQAAFTQLQRLLGMGPPGQMGANTNQMLATLQNLPGYQFTLGQGLKSVQNGFAARGLGSSGAALRGAADYTTGLAQSQYGNYFNQLLGTAQLGQNAAAQTGNIGAGLAQTGGNALIGAGNAQAAGILGVGNSINNALNTGSGLYMTNSLLQQQGYPGFWGSSDRRLKTDITPVGKLKNGLTWYQFRFKSDPAKVHEGVMADEVMQVMPTAVRTDDNGFMEVNYTEVAAHG